MSKSYIKKTQSLVIVESPAKCAKIESYLGSRYKCVASFGHLRTLSSLDSIDINNNFSPSFNIIDDPKKKKHIEFLRTEIKNAEEVILATDGDREGESIAWHICDLFELPVKTTKRIVFHEITESALQHAICHPRIIDMNLVYAQQSRQILDILVGFTITPLLWKYISRTSENSLSAGRCQTPALRIVYDNQQEINNSPGEKKYTTTGYVGMCIPFVLNAHYENEEQVIDFLDNSQDFNHIYSRTEPKRTFKQGPEPLTTSRVQQIASNEMHISPKETMKICQTLYEGGFITYMRTDSKKYCQEFIDSVKEYILRNYNLERYISSTIDNNTTGPIKGPIKGPISSNNTKELHQQEAHEAIRPTNINMRDLENDDLTTKEKKMYKLIWETSLESCMSPSEFYEITASISAYNNTKYVNIGEKMDFPGWKAVKKSSKEKEKNIENSDKEYHYLLQVKQDSTITIKKVTSIMSLSKLKQHYSEAKLVQLLEENGIGRPSTFSSIIDKIQERGYVKKEDVKGVEISCRNFELEDNIITETTIMKEFGNEKGKLVLQPLGTIVLDFLCEHFDHLFNYEYTSSMESELDKVSKGTIDWHDICNKCLLEMNSQIDKMTDVNKQEIKIDETHTYIIGKHGPVIKCTTNKSDVSFKPVIKNVNLTKLKNGEYKLEELIDNTKKTSHVLGKYEEEDLILRKGKFGMYVNWGTNTKSMSCFGNRPLDNITYDEVVSILNSSTTPTPKDENGRIIFQTNIIREISDSISIRKGQYGDYIFHKSSKMKKPMFYKLDKFKDDYKTCHVNIIRNWIIEEYQIRP